MASVFEQLGFNFQPSKDDEIIEFSESTKRTLNAVPKFLDEWQYEDLRNNDTAASNYVKNPTRAISELIIDTTSDILSVSSGVGNLSNVVASCLNILDHYIPGAEESDPPIFVKGSSTKYIEHCDRLCGIVELTPATAELPHYDTAMSVGKTLIYIVNQADGIINNAPLMGSFTSLLVDDDLTEKHNIIVNYPPLINASISCTTTEVEGNTVTVCTSNLTSQQITQIVNDLNEINTIFDGRRIHDENFFNNSKTITDKFRRLKRYSNPGESEKNVFKNYIGTDRLKNNLKL